MEDVTTRIGILYLDLLIPGSHSLKDKRRVLQKFKNQVRSKFNVSISELDGYDKWQRALIGIAMIGNDDRFMGSALENIISFTADFHSVELNDHEVEFY